MLRVAVRLGCLKRNSLVLRKKTQSQREQTRLQTCGSYSCTRAHPATLTALTLAGCSPACWTNPISNLRSSSGAFPLLSSFPENLLQTETKSHHQTVLGTAAGRKLALPNKAPVLHLRSYARCPLKLTAPISSRCGLPDRFYWSI